MIKVVWTYEVFGQDYMYNCNKGIILHSLKEQFKMHRFIIITISYMQIKAGKLDLPLL